IYNLVIIGDSMYKLLDGKKYSLEIKEKLAKIFSNIDQKDNTITLGILQVGDLEQSNIYIRHKLKFAEDLNIKTYFKKIAENASFDEIKDAICETANNSTGMIIQLPIMSNKISANELEKLLNYVPKEKDIDGLNDINYELEDHKKAFLPATALGIILLLKEYKINVINNDIAIIGKSKIVGKPLAHYFKKTNNLVRVYDENTSRNDLKNSNIIVVATGQKNPIKLEDIKQNCVIVDVGIHKINGKISGDLDFEIFAQKASFITPVPGGVGPMTVSSLILNLIKSDLIQNPEKISLYKNILHFIEM
ncbi:bifunctional 5,10-methylenetetrahydrofolate dehydrogenase/5,10-methenyltetrahydrofolate cyclohydrolase, partial [Metamycoplasma hyosynoviae]|uniref:bifunctional 5,10-methylenetetrahydrofolate dehydrogenase/5,10-methenyltetrahydrofolate cyclohydrolase n=2 Tax=Metamycoplasma hyosynoviae TaxID=29559 RepID=UPI0023625F96